MQERKVHFYILALCPIGMLTVLKQRFGGLAFTCGKYRSSFDFQPFSQVDKFLRFQLFGSSGGIKSIRV